MAAPWRKRRKFHQPRPRPFLREDKDFEAKFPDICIFIIHAKIQNERLEQLWKLAQSKGFKVSRELDDNVTHVVTEFESREQVVNLLKRIVENSRKEDFNVEEFAQKAELLSLKWFTECMEAEKPVEITDEHRLPEKKEFKPQDPDEDREGNTRNNRKFACQRITPVNHPNKKYTEALEMLERFADLKMDEGSKLRMLAFRKASAALKALPEEIKSKDDLENLWDIRPGSHCYRVITDILEHGYSGELDRLMRNEWLMSMNVFSKVFGSGLITALKWCQMGFRSLTDIKGSYILNLTKAQQKGIDFYKELNNPMSRAEADWIRRTVAKELRDIDKKLSLEMVGGFRRGQEMGHDVDFLISHPVEGREKDVLPALLQRLAKKSCLDYTDVQNSNIQAPSNPYRQDKKPDFDNYERCFTIFRLPKSEAHPVKKETTYPFAPDFTRSSGFVPRAFPEEMDQIPSTSNGESEATNGQSGSRKRRASTDPDGNSVVKNTPEEAAAPEAESASPVEEDTGRSWLARRVDFVIVPQSQYAFALLGWSGSKMFVRSMRDYANKVMNMNLNSHGLLDRANNTYLPAKTEREIFQLLKLEYKKPEERNC